MRTASGPVQPCHCGSEPVRLRRCGGHHTVPHAKILALTMLTTGLSAKTDETAMFRSCVELSERLGSGAVSVT
jgi:hypothetical protein